MWVSGSSLWSAALHRRRFDHRQRLETHRLHAERVLLHRLQDGRTQLRRESDITTRTGLFSGAANRSRTVIGPGFSRTRWCLHAHLALAEGEAGVDVLPVNPLQEAAAPAQGRLLLPRLELAEQLTVHLPTSTESASPHLPWEVSRHGRSPHLPALPYDGLSGRRVGLRPQDGRGGALVSAVALPERSLYSSTSC